MNSSQAWNAIISKLSDKPLEFPTIPKTKRNPVWFSATTDGDVIFIDKAVNNRPSSDLTQVRKLKYSTFQKIYPIFLRRENGEPVSAEATSVTVDQVYYYSLIKHLCQFD